MNRLEAWKDTGTSSVGSVTRMLSIGGTRSGTSGCPHSIRRTGAKGSNGHQRREQGLCVYCGKRFQRVIRWDTKDAKSWWEAV